ncbi:geranylgeranyltransferase, putative [Plasmodium knowlesi strain H]|uniref:Geranylgeranyl transferase type-2 subunit beta n=3 Tax=Plasmodium knowlesi TaxID=5850 RepID=A0A5K1TZU5_PLAKH|nr:geranylgeranyl transferase type-2 subunit beta, putative [Plasmodium knowlesi strain H]OTN64662.1 putative Geranyl-geranyl transferase [Plasmodium knowlesi]CAA9989309.1 geranylgeranyl transferase type-2 subunit beta, putative [Plasmodium knowlesi strain H]SBO26116.1 geranylgeranyltransferase, putative [Plasmodium knowlesi strain H]SBO26776.1 geranylgeranyltransferase, putative [Plasmodium knowlesi strain H]VVS78783.1 geranylgeranyl transferase type-2 subunit beta, putative [Plasmodium knowl|eukprot:XP_002261656.1 geranyl-geranyl transferase, putative [Plasmodium knowlesi strain H]
MDQIQFVKDKHLKYLNTYTDTTNGEELIFNETLKMRGVFYYICSCKILSHEIEKKEEFINFILQCQNPDGGFSNNKSHDSNIVSTHYAILSLLLLNHPFDGINPYFHSLNPPHDGDNSPKNITDSTAEYILSLLNEDGSFKGDIWGEVDVRFACSAVSCLTILNRLSLVSRDKIASYVLTNYSICQNGFSWTSGNEPHAASVFCAVVTLFLIEKLHLINEEKIGEWLSLRQTNSGGFNGRAEKLSDTCYAWWIYSSLIILGKYKWVNKNALKNYILLCQDLKTGGISDNPDCLPDICHTFFGLAALSLIDNLHGADGRLNLRLVHPVYAIPLDVVRERGLPHPDVETG